MGSQVAVAEVAVVPTFKGFRRKTTAETEGAATEAARGFSRIFSKTGTDSGKATGTGFKRAFESSAQGASDKLTKQLEGDVAKASRALSAARLKEQDAAGKTRVAEAQLAEARKKYASDSSQVIRAQERMESSSRQLATAHGRTEGATEDLKKAQGELARAADRAGDQLAEAGSRGVAGFRSNVIGGVKSFALPLIGAFAALGIGNIVADAFRTAKDFVLGSIDIASDLNESVNAVGVSYGDAAAAVLKLGENSAQAFGLSKRDLNSYATQFSGFVKTIAGEGGNVAGTLEQLVGRGTDFASVFNLEVADALQLFQSGLAGETEPLRKYSIDLSAAAVEAYALANGIGDGTGALTEAEKVQARYGSLLAQTSAVQGDFVNTGGELANMNRKNTATWDDLQAKIGSAFLPVATDLARVIGTDVLPVIADLAEKEGPALTKAFADVLPELTELAKELLPLLPGLLRSAAESLPAIINGIAILAPLLVEGAEGFNGVVTAVGVFFALISGSTAPEELYEKMINLPGPVGDAARSFSAAGSEMGRAMGEAANAVRTKIDEAVAFVQSLPARAVIALAGLGGTLYNSGRSLMQGFVDGIEDMFTPITNAVSTALRLVKDYFPHSPAKRGPFSGSGWTDVGKSGKATFQEWADGFSSARGISFPDVGDFPDLPTGGSAGSASAGSWSAPSELVILDADRQLIGRMQVEADARVSARGRAMTADLSSRRRSDA